ncbi:PQQ-binding-like beta-propeller repeat protein [Fimbriiglobus ruber]|uniref:Outer membrane protein, OmpA/MotB family n=1 Tax=Fimbriiglobus ruber TaxID=1908690 RepID=A0A225DSX6_9BACT|nr:PQQ-binding-like beta-propeller repeat protein [Fimbriiglobus ruber]OWK41648.1 Outer membrane protein, OmpA/MotB family [Fimbriiglobus ruber]
MTIAVVCPHCETEFQLSPDLRGKSMRCPECREVFEVQEKAGPPTAPEPPPAATPEHSPPGPPAPIPSAGRVSDFVPFLEVEAAPQTGRPYERIEGQAAERFEVVRESEPFTPTLAGDSGRPAPRPAERLPAPPPAPPAILLPGPPGRPPAPPAVLLPPPPEAKLLNVPVAREAGPWSGRTPGLGTTTGPKEVAWSGDAPPAILLPPPKSAGGPKELDWSGAAPPAITIPPPRQPVDDGTPFVRSGRRGGRGWSKVLLASVASLLVLTVVATVVMLFRHFALTEERLVEEAQEAYKEANYPVSQKKYEQLLKDFPGSENTSRYQFFAALCETQAAVGSVTARENPAPAMKSFQGFVAEYGTSPHAQPGTGYGTDIVQVGRRLADTVADNGGDHLKTFKADRKKADELEATDRSIADGRALIPQVDKFRDKEAGSLDPQRGRFDALAKEVAAERARLAVLAPFRNLADDPTAARIEVFEKALADNKLTDDEEAKQMKAKAEARLRDIIRQQVYTPVPARRPPPDPYPPVLFAAAVANSPLPRPVPGTAADVVFAVARGVLYALDAQTGGLLWGSRIAAPTAGPQAADLPVRVSPGGGADDWVLIAGEWAGVPSMTARLARTGEVVWYQPLTPTAKGEPVAPAGRPVVIGTRAYVPLADRLGTVVEFDTATGDRTGEIALRQPIGAGMAVLPGTQPGVDYLFVAGDAKRVFALEVGSEDARGEKLPPRVVRVMLTEHPRGSLRGEPLVLASADPGGPRFLILTQIDGATGMKLRTFPLPATVAPEPTAATDPAAPASPAAATPVDAPTAAEVSVPGWSWFPAVSDGERVVLATDAGAFLAFGVNQAGNTDRPLFALPAPKPVADADAVARSQIVSADEDSYWAVLGGQLTRFRTAVGPAGGLRIVAMGAGRAVGEPVHRAQIRPASDLGVIVTRVGLSGNVQAVGFDVRTGQIRWQRRVGVTPAGPPVGPENGPLVVADEDGGVYAVSAANPSAAAVVAPPYADLATRAVTVGSTDGQTAWVLVPEVGPNGRRVRARATVGGVLKMDAVVPLPDQLAGAPVVMGGAVLVPLANGYVYRLAPGAAQFSQGPLWRGDTARGEPGAADPVCHLAPEGADEFLATDGGRAILLWKWPVAAGAKPEKKGGSWEAGGKIAIPPAVVPTAAGGRVVAADEAGVVYVFAVDKPGPPVARLRGSADGPIPAGTPTDRFVVAGPGDRAIAIYSVNHKILVALDLDRGEPAWVKTPAAQPDAGDLAGWVVRGDRVVATDQRGHLVVVDVATGTDVADIPPPISGAVATVPAVPLSESAALVVLADGTGTVVELSPQAEVAPEPRKK